MATRFPFGTGSSSNAMAMSNRSSTVSTRITPDWPSSASTATSAPASAPVCELAARAPTPVRPAFTTTIGFFFVI